ncbi:MAG: hypothetical protein GY850_19515 [bacterium]|nr:hypothetical protein [bacterium]
MAALQFEVSETISPETFPPFILQRTYNIRNNVKGILGAGWYCWPFDATIQKANVKDTEVLSARSKNSDKKLYVQIRKDVFAPLNSSRIGTVTLQKKPDGYLLTDILSGRQAFDSAGRLVKITDTAGNALEILRNKEGLPASVIVYQPRKVTYQITCDPEKKRLMKIQAPDGQKWQYEYDKDGNLVKMVDKEKFVLYYKYQKNLLVEKADSSGRWVKYQYDRKGRLVEKDRNSRKEKRSYAYLPSSPKDWMVTTTDPLGRKTEYRFLISKKQDVIREKDGNVVVKQYDENWQLQHISSLKNGVTSFIRDTRGRINGILDNRNRLSRIRYDNALGLPSAVIDDRGQVRKMHYNRHGQLILDHRANGRKISVRYNHFGQPLNISDSVWGVSKFQYGASGKLEFVDNETMGAIDPVEMEQKNELSAFLRRPAFQNIPIPAQRRRVVRALDPAVMVSQDRNERTQTVQTEGGKKWVCTYDVFGNMVQIRENGRQVAGFQYDDVDRLLEIRYSETTAEQFAYNINDQVVRYIALNGNTYEYDYDFRGFLIKEKAPGREAYIFEYDKKGRLVSAFDSFWHDLFAHDSRGQLVKIGRMTPVSKAPETLVTYTYDIAGRLESALFANGLRCTHEYSKSGDMETLRFSGTKIVIHYDPHRRCRSISYPGGMQVEYGYAEYGGLSRLAITDSNAKTRASQFCRYQDKRLNKVFSKSPEGTGQYTFAYAADGQLKKILFNGQPIGVTGDPGLKKSFDALGRLRLTGKEGTMTEYSYGLGGVIGAKTRDTELHFVRSSDGVARALVQDGKIWFLVAGVVPGEAFAIDRNNLKIQLIQFRDTTRPIISLGKGGS